MGKYKLWAGAALLTLSLLAVIALNARKSEAAKAVKEANLKEALVRKKEAKAYLQKQQKLHDAIRVYFEKAIQAGDIVGAGVSIVKGDSIIISTGFGKRSITGTAKVDGETIFRLGSLSKGFASVLVADLKQEGKLDWNDKLVDYIPDFQFGDATNTQKVKLAHILSHTSGTPYHSYTNLVEANIPMASIATRFDDVEPLNEPGVQYSYQNAMYALSQEVLLRVTGKDVKTLLRNRFFIPLEMNSISMDHEALMKEKNVALPHSRRKNGWGSLPLRNRYYNAVVAGGINASSLDMAKWMRFLLGHKPEVMKKKAINEVFEPFIELNDNNKYYQRWPGHIKSAYGYGWRIHTFQNENANAEVTIWHHGGSVNNYRNEIALFPEADLGVCVLLNGNSRFASTVIPDLRELIKQVSTTGDRF